MTQVLNKTKGRVDEFKEETSDLILKEKRETERKHI